MKKKLILITLLNFMECLHDYTWFEMILFMNWFIMCFQMSMFFSVSIHIGSNLVNCYLKCNTDLPDSHRSKAFGQYSWVGYNSACTLVMWVNFRVYQRFIRHMFLGRNIVFRGYFQNIRQSRFWGCWGQRTLEIELWDFKHIKKS